MEIKCVNCGSEDLARDGEAPQSGDIAMVCLACGWRGRRTPTVSCHRCGSPDLDEVAVDSWAYADLEEASQNPESPAWGYVDKTQYSCTKCHNRWTVAGEFRPYTGDQGAAIISFEDDDSGYRTWLRTWPIGFVLNCNRHPSPDYLILHRATCQFITELNSRMKTFTGEYIKVCSTDSSAVKQWARTLTGAETTECMHCL